MTNYPFSSCANGSVLSRHVSINLTRWQNVQSTAEACGNLAFYSGGLHWSVGQLWPADGAKWSLWNSPESTGSSLRGPKLHTSRSCRWAVWTDRVPVVFVSPQQEAAGCDPLDELYDALAEVVAVGDTTECYKSYLLVPANTRHSGSSWCFVMVLLAAEPPGRAPGCEAN